MEEYAQKLQQELKKISQLVERLLHEQSCYSEEAYQKELSKAIIDAHELSKKLESAQNDRIHEVAHATLHVCGQYLSTPVGVVSLRKAADEFQRGHIHYFEGVLLNLAKDTSGTQTLIIELEKLAA